MCEDLSLENTFSGSNLCRLGILLCLPIEIENAEPLSEYLSVEEESTITKLTGQMFWFSKLYKTHEVNPRWIEALMGL